MDNPLQLLTEVFHPDYRVNLSLDRPDGSLTLTLSDAQGRVARHRISPAQSRNRQLLQSLVERVQRELASPAKATTSCDFQTSAEPGTVRGLPTSSNAIQRTSGGLSMPGREGAGVEGKRAEA